MKPPVGVHKHNTDGSFKTLNADCGGLIREFNGDIIASFEGTSLVKNTIMAEIQTLKYGVQLSIYLGITNVWIEVDAKLMIHYINGIFNGNPSYFNIIREIHQCLSLITYSISHIYKEGNLVADFFANEGCNVLDFVNYVGTSIPRKLVGLVRLDRICHPYVRNY